MKLSPVQRYWVKLGTSVGLLALLIYVLPWSEVRAAFARASGTTWAAVFALFVLGHVLGTLKWRLLVNSRRGGLSFRAAASAYFAALFANLCLPSIVGGDVLRATLASRASGRPEAAVLGGIVDRMLDILTMVLLALAGTAMTPGAKLQWSASPMVRPMLIAAGLGGAVMILLLRRPLRRWPRRLRRTVARVLIAFRSLARSPRSAIIAMLLSLGVQALFVMLNAALGRSIGIELPLAAWFFAWPVAKVASLAPISLGGIAVRDAALAGLLAMFGVPFAQGVVAGLLWQSINIAGGLFGGVVWWTLAAGRPRLSSLTPAMSEGR